MIVKAEFAFSDSESITLTDGSESSNIYYFAVEDDKDVAELHLTLEQLETLGNGILAYVRTRK